MHPGSIRQSGLLFHVGYESTFPGVSPQGEGRQEEIQCPGVPFGGLAAAVLFQRADPRDAPGTKHQSRQDQDPARPMNR